MDAEVAQLAYDASRHQLSCQEASLDNLRGRAGTLLTANAIIAAFLGGTALRESPALGCWDRLAIGQFVLAGIVIAVVLLPLFKWEFALSATDIAKVDAKRGDKLLLHAVALRLDRAYRTNSTRLTLLMWGVILAALLVVGQGLAWLFSVA